MTDIQKVQSLIQKTLNGVIGLLENANTNAQAVKIKYNNANPSLAGSNLDTDQVEDVTALFSWLNDGLTITHASTIAMLKSKDIPSHRGVSLD